MVHNYYFALTGILFCKAKHFIVLVILQSIC